VHRFTVNAATDIFYLYSKARNLSSARSAVAFLLNAFRVVSVMHEDCIAAMKLPIADFEDALVEVCARKDGADYIVTRDEQFLNSQSAIPLIQPQDLLNNISYIGPMVVCGDSSSPYSFGARVV
jgi:hypothetical protein